MCERCKSSPHKDSCTVCPECDTFHTDEKYPTIGQVLGPCSDKWWKNAIAGTGWENY